MVAWASSLVTPPFTWVLEQAGNTAHQHFCGKTATMLVAALQTNYSLDI